MKHLKTDAMMFFNKNPASFHLYEVFEKKVCKRFDPIIIQVQKTQITFKNRYIFACVSLARVKKKAELPPEYIVITLGLPSPLDSQRIAVKTEPYPGRWTHHIVIGSEAEIDDELMNWVRQAYDFAALK